MDSSGEDISSLKRKSTLELLNSDVSGVERKSSRVHAVASVRAATSKLTSVSKTRTESLVQKTSIQKASSKSKKKSSLTQTSSLTKLTSRVSLTKSTSKATSNASLTKTPSKASLTKSASKTSLSKTPSKGSLTKSSSKASLTKSASKASLTKSSSKTSVTNAVAFKSRLTSTENGGKKLWFLKGCHVAVRAQADPGFFLCRLEQNVFNCTKDVKVRWLSVAGTRFDPNLFKMSYLDRIDPASILMQVELVRKSLLRFRLTSIQEQEIKNMIQLVEDVESGTISVQDIDDDVQEVVQIDEPPKKKPRMVKTPSQRVRDKASKSVSKKSSPRAKKTDKEETKEKKERKRKVPQKEQDLKLNPRPLFKVLDKDPLFETREPMPYVSKVSNSKLIYRAINLGDAAMLKKLLKDGSRIKYLYSKSVSCKDAPVAELAKNLNKEVMAVLMEEMMDSKFKKRLENNPDDVNTMDRTGTGNYNQRSLAVSRIFQIQASRGSKEGNNAFLHLETRYNGGWSWATVTECLTEHGVSPSTVDGLEEHFKKLKPLQADSFETEYWGNRSAVEALLRGQHKRAARYLKNLFRGKHFASESLMTNVLLFDDEDLTQCPPSAVKEACKRVEKITAIHCAAANPNSKYLKKLLSVQPNPQVPDIKGRRAIHYAAGCSTPDNLKLLLTWRVNTHDTDTDMKIPLHYAVLARRPENVQALINHDKKSSMSDPNCVRFGVAGVNRPMKNSLTPLHQAALMEEVGIASILLSSGALVNATTSVGDFKRTPLQIAAGTGNLEMVKLLIKHGAVVEQRDRLGRSALLIACMNGSTKVLSYLLHIGANPEHADTSDNTPLHYAAAYGWYFTVRMLMEVGVDPNASNMWKISPLFVAYMKGHVGIVRQLLGYKSISINQILNDGSTLLFHACGSDMTQPDLFEQIEYMIKEKGALCDIKDLKGGTALFYLARATFGDKDKVSEGHQQAIKIAQLLLDNGCDINATDDDGFTAVMRALGWVSNTSLASFLMKKGCQVLGPADGERTTTVLHEICDNLTTTSTGLPKIMEIMKQPKYIKVFRDMAKCYNKNGYTPLLQLCTYYRGLYQHNAKTENEVHRVAFCKFLVETLHSPINAVVIKKYVEPDAVLQDSRYGLYANSHHGGRNALLLLTDCGWADSLMETESENTKITLLRYFVDRGMDLNIVAEKGESLLYFCVKYDCEKIIKCLGDTAGSLDVDQKVKIYDNCQHNFFFCQSLSVVNALLDIGCNPNILIDNEKYRTVMHKVILEDGISAIREDILQIVEKKLSNESKGPEFDFNTKDWRGRTVLHELARVNPGTLSTSLELEFKIIQNGGKVGMQDNKGRTPLHYVFKPKRIRWSSGGRDSSVDATQLTQLMAKCMTASEINTRDYNGQTALHMAARMGASVSCVTLLSLGKTKADISLYDKDGNTALTLAVLNKKDACAVSLIQAGASLKDDVVQLSDREEKTREMARKTAYTRQAAMDEEDDDDDDDNSFWTIKEEEHIEQSVEVSRIPLYKAAMMNGLQGVAMLISQADPSESGCSPMDFIKMAFEERHYNIALEILCNQWGSGQLRKLDKDGRNLLHLLAISCHRASEDEDPLVCKVATFLIKEKMPTEQKDKEGLYPVHWAIINHHFDLAELLAEHSTGFDKDPNGRPMGYLEAALWRIYSKNGITEKVWNFMKKMADKGMNLDQYIKVPMYPELFADYLKGKKKDPELSERRTTSATTALIVSIRSTESGQPFTTNLLKADVSPNLADSQQVTPLMHAVMKNDAEYVSVLLNYDYPECMKKDVDTVATSKKKKPNTSIFRLKPQDTEDDSEAESEEEEDEESEADKSDEEEDEEKELRPVPKTSDVDLDAKDRAGRTALHYVASPDPSGTYDNAKLAFLLVKAGAKELKDKAGMTPFALAMKTGALDVADMLKSLGHGKKDNQKPNFDKHFPVKDGITFKPSLHAKPNFRNDARLAFAEQMEEDRAYEHTTDKNCTAKNGILLKDEAQDFWYDVLLTKVDVKRGIYATYNFYKIQLVRQSNPNLYVLFTTWGCIGMLGQFQNTPFSDMAAAHKEFCKIFREKTGNKWEDVKQFEIKPRKYRLLDDSARLAPAKMDNVDIDVDSSARSALPGHLLDLMTNIMKPENLTNAIERLTSLCLESLPFGRLTRERLQQGRNLLIDIRNLLDEAGDISKLKEEERAAKQSRYTEIHEKIVEISNEYFHTIPQTDYVYESIWPLSNTNKLVHHLQSVDNLLDYEIASQMLKGAMTCKADTHPADYVYRCLDCKLELMQQSDPMAQLILKYIYTTANPDDKITGIYKVSREGEAARLEKTGLENRRMLFHGTKASNLMSILSRGLVTIYPEHGSAYGHGIYFADKFSKSRNYSGNFGVMLLCEVALGKQYIYGSGRDDDPPIDEIFTKKGYDSLVGSDYNKIALKNWFKLPSGVSMKLSPGTYRDPEYVVLNPDQVCIRYLIKFQHRM